MKISVYAISKNESKFVDRWMDSMSEADEIVVLDTGSEDDTVEKLDVSGNPFSPSGAAALVAVVRNKPSIKEYAGFEI